MGKKINLIDIHAHLIPNVDDGSKSFSESIEMIKDMIKQGITHCIVTPHFQSKQQYVSSEEVKEKFQLLKNYKNEEKLDINLYLGYEVMYLNHSRIDYSKYTLNNSKYVLLEFNLIDELPISEIVFNISRKGVTPIIAHIERYKYLEVEDVVKIKSNGALIQVNADSLLADKARKTRSFTRKLLKYKLIDFIASDTHNMTKRSCKINEAYLYAIKKSDKEYVDDIFKNNALKILDK